MMTWMTIYIYLVGEHHESGRNEEHLSQHFVIFQLPDKFSRYCNGTKLPLQLLWLYSKVDIQTREAISSTILDAMSLQW